MKAKLLLGDGKPRVDPTELKSTLRKAGIEVGDRGADFGIVVGGDGRFSYYGRTESVPLLFVGVRSKRATGSKAYLAAVFYDELPTALERIARRDYSVEEQPRLEVFKNGREAGEVFTDVYLQRGEQATCIRYKVLVSGEGVSIEDAAIGDGVIVATRAGATGYYSYPDRIKGDAVDTRAYAEIGAGEVGICHINPTYTEREGQDGHPLRYRVPWGSKIQLYLFRPANARLYGAAGATRGIKVTLKDRITVAPAKRVTKVMTLA